MSDQTSPTSRRDHLSLTLAFAITILSAAGLFGLSVREAAFFSRHTEQKTRLLRLPLELQHTQKALAHEQQELRRIQQEIRLQMNRGSAR